jgi:hypothetical protein
MTTDTGMATKNDGAAPASTCRDPRTDPQKGDRLEKQMKTCVRTRTVTNRVGFEIVYFESHWSWGARAMINSQPKTCWISTWMEWAREAKVVHDPGDIFKMPKEQAMKLLSGLEQEGTLLKYLQEHYPEYIGRDGKVLSITLGVALGLIPK